MWRLHEFDKWNGTQNALAPKPDTNLHSEKVHELKIVQGAIIEEVAMKTGD